MIVRCLKPDQEAKIQKAIQITISQKKYQKIFGSLKNVFEFSEESETFPYPLSILSTLFTYILS